ncbi:succinate dehydrogenase, hydrophobic membrane anchor protein [Pseudoxanthomonas sangjuensis]|uniref:succinate dehydrogenase, hydrophobic membrane anchor protein n=1 Tax=Pseudoxanthomonas sangjuensis TaxID=1503750 RepID=UPI001391D64B|nr:succinate dehydrogenase, hydrophobic membrane anchor protein [Pseudoxanthomonas sangjuensis]KAF1713288.1 succinate dehydrogenase, hydrophobic membrane anchor protein [Pseudoxanthomonas sangjuensis]
MSRFRTPLKNARGLGSAKEGLHHWIIQRITAVALVFLGCWFVYFVVGLVGSDRVAATEAIARPWNAVLLIAFLISGFWHAQLGLQVVLEDYVHSPLSAAVLQLAVRFACVLAALAGIFAVVLIALGRV